MGDLLRIALTLAIGTVGGAIFFWLNLPLPWLLGAMLSVTIVSIGGFEMKSRIELRNMGLAVLGVFIGSGYGPHAFDGIATWVPTILGTMLVTTIAGSAGIWYLKSRAHQDSATAYFSAMPGGMNEMVVVGERFGADIRYVALSHAVRVLVTISFVAFAFRIMDGYVPDPSVRGQDHPFILSQQLMLLAVAVTGALVGRLLRLPAPFFFGPILFSIAAHGFGLEGQPPALLQAAAQVVVGSTLGSRFVGVTARDISSTMWRSCIVTGIQLSAALGVAAVLGQLLPWGTKTIFLAFAPAGIAEMTITAIALGYDAPFVAAHQLARVILVFALSPLVFGYLKRRALSKGKQTP